MSTDSNTTRAIAAFIANEFEPGGRFEVNGEDFEIASAWGNGSTVNIALESSSGRIVRVCVSVAGEAFEPSRDDVRNEIDRLRVWARNAGQPFTLDSCTQAITQKMDGETLLAWTVAIADQWTRFDVVEDQS